MNLPSSIFSRNQSCRHIKASTVLKPSELRGVFLTGPSGRPAGLIFSPHPTRIFHRVEIMARTRPPCSSGRVGSGFFRAGRSGFFGSGGPCPGLIRGATGKWSQGCGRRKVGTWLLGGYFGFLTNSQRTPKKQTSCTQTHRSKRKTINPSRSAETTLLALPRPARIA